MFLNFFDELRAAKVPVTLREYLALLEGMDKQVIRSRLILGAIESRCPNLFLLYKKE